MNNTEKLVGIIFGGLSTVVTNFLGWTEFYELIEIVFTAFVGASIGFFTTMMWRKVFGKKNKNAG